MWTSITNEDQKRTSITVRVFIDQFFLSSIAIFWSSIKLFGPIAFWRTSSIIDHFHRSSSKSRHQNVTIHDRVSVPLGKTFSSSKMLITVTSYQCGNRICDSTLINSEMTRKRRVIFCTLQAFNDWLVTSIFCCVAVGKCCRRSIKSDLFVG